MAAAIVRAGFSTVLVLCGLKFRQLSPKRKAVKSSLFVRNLTVNLLLAHGHELIAIGLKALVSATLG